MHFQNNFYMLFMTMPNVKKMFYILCVHRLMSTSFLCFKMTLGLKRIFLNHCLHYTTKTPHRILVQSAFLRKKHEMNCSQCGAWGSQMAFLCMCIWYRGPWNIVNIFGALKSCEEVNSKYPSQRPEVNSGSWRVIFFLSGTTKPTINTLQIIMNNL